MLKNNIYAYEDDYMFFMFNGIHSSQYNLAIQNSMDDLKIILSTDGKADFVSASHQVGQHFTGVTHTSKKIKLKLVAQSLTRRQAIEMGRWLKLGTQAPLIFDFDTDWAYDVVITSSNDMTLYEEGLSLFTVTYEVEFTTASSPYARTTYNASVLYCGDGSAQQIQDSAFQNKMHIPAIVLGEQLYSTETKQYSRVAKLICLGDSSMYFGVVNSFTPAEDEKSKINSKHYFAISADAGYDDFNTSISIVINDSLLGKEHVIAYNSETNNFLADDTLPQQAKLYNHYEELSVKYNYRRLELASPGTPFQLKEKIDNLYDLFASPYHWLVCKPSEIKAYEYIEARLNDNSTEPDFISWSVYGCEVFEMSDGQTIEEFIENTLQKGNSESKEWQDYYFCYYYPITLTWTDETNSTQGFINLTQYKEAI